MRTRKIALGAFAALCTAAAIAGAGLLGYKLFLRPQSTTDVLGVVATQKDLNITNKIRNVINNNDGSFTVTYDYVITNKSKYNIEEIKSTSNLSKTFSPHKYDLINLTTNKLALNKPAYNGGSNINLLKGTDMLKAGETANITITVRLYPEKGSKGPFENHVDVSGIVDGPEEESKKGSEENKNKNEQDKSKTPDQNKKPGEDKKTDQKKPEPKKDDKGGKGVGTNPTPPPSNTKPGDQNKKPGDNGGNQGGNEQNQDKNKQEQEKKEQKDASKTKQVANDEAKVSFTLPEDEIETQDDVKNKVNTPEITTTEVGEDEDTVQTDTQTAEQNDNQLEGSKSGFTTAAQQEELAETGFELNLLGGQALAAAALGAVAILNKDDIRRKLAKSATRKA